MRSHFAASRAKRRYVGVDHVDFIDASGDSVLKLNAGSSKYFTLALVAFQNHDEALAADDRISLLRKEQGLPDNFEFHFHKVSLAYRRIFLEAIAPYDFFYFAVVINKANIARHELQF